MEILQNENNLIFLHNVLIGIITRMEIKRLVNIITSRLAYLSTEVKLNGALNLLDSNVLSEEVFMTILNITYGYNLQNANIIEHNAKAIDLIDIDSKLIIQVSSDNSKTKVQSSLSKIDLARFHGYSFKFVCISKRVSHLKKAEFNIPSSINFDATNDCFDIERIGKDIQGRGIDAMRLLAEFLEKSILPASANERRPSVITYVINQLAETSLANMDFVPDVKPFDFSPKIDLNNLIRWKSVVSDYAVYSVLVGNIYSQYDKLGVNKSFVVLSSLHDMYSNLSITYTGDELFDQLLLKVYEIVDGDETCNASLTKEELLLNIKIVLVDAFVKCKIFKKPI